LITKENAFFLLFSQEKNAHDSALAIPSCNSCQTVSQFGTNYAPIRHELQANSARIVRQRDLGAKTGLTYP